MKKHLWVITVILIVQIVLFSLVGVYIWYTFIIDDIKEPIGNSNSFRYGPVLLKFDEEWVMTDGTRRFIRVAFDKYWIDDDDVKYEKFAPESLAINTSTALIVNENISTMSIKIQYYDIPIESNEIWIDLYISMVYTVTDSDSKLHDFYTDSTYLYAPREFYFYHPTKKRWGGSERITGYSIWDMDESVYNRDFQSSFEFEKYMDDYRDMVLYDSDFAAKILDKRVLRLPPTKPIESNQMMFEESGLFTWYKEITEEEIKEAEDVEAEFDDESDAESDE